jgi:hypothetical protein
VIHGTTFVLLASTSPQIKLACRIIKDPSSKPSVLLYIITVMPMVSENLAPHWFINLKDPVRTFRVIGVWVVETFAPAYRQGAYAVFFEVFTDYRCHLIRRLCVHAHEIYDLPNFRPYIHLTTLSVLSHVLCHDPSRWHHGRSSTLVASSSCLLHGSTLARTFASPNTGLIVFNSKIQTVNSDGTAIANI